MHALKTLQDCRASITRLHGFQESQKSRFLFEIIPFKKYSLSQTKSAVGWILLLSPQFVISALISITLITLSKSPLFSWSWTDQSQPFSFVCLVEPFSMIRALLFPGATEIRLPIIATVLHYVFFLLVIPASPLWGYCCPRVHTASDQFHSLPAETGRAAGVVCLTPCLLTPHLAHSWPLSNPLPPPVPHTEWPLCLCFSHPRAGPCN